MSCKILGVSRVNALYRIVLYLYIRGGTRALEDIKSKAYGPSNPNKVVQPRVQIEKR